MGGNEPGREQVLASAQRTPRSVLPIAPATVNRVHSNYTCLVCISPVQDPGTRSHHDARMGSVEPWRSSSATDEHVSAPLAFVAARWIGSPSTLISIC